MMIGRNIRTLLVLLFIIFLPVFWLFRPVDGLPARFDHAECGRVALTDTQNGRPVVGAADLHLLSDGDTLLLAAADWLALDRNPASARNGGLYRISLSGLLQGDTWARPILSQETAPGGLFPLSLAVSADDELLAFINRERDGRTAIIGGRYRDGSFSPRYARTDGELCRARDLQFAGDGEMPVHVTLDRAKCDFSLAELDPRAATGGVAAVDLAGFQKPSPVVSGLAEAQGIAGLYISEARLWRLHDQLDEPVEVPGGPDRLNWDRAGGLVAALHPSLPMKMAYRYGFTGSAPSRIVRVDLDRRVEVLFDDPGGEVYSAASSAILAGSTLIAGSELENGLLVCRRPGS